MQAILSKIDDLASKLKSLLPMKPEWQTKLDKKFRLAFNFNSNHMEGNTLTYGETELLLIFDQTKGEHTLREYEEMKAHVSAHRCRPRRRQDGGHSVY
jgi:Fic family protein